VKTHLLYGRGTLDIDVPDDAQVLRPAAVPGLPDPEGAIRAALTSPIHSPPLGKLARGVCGQPVCVVVSDITRPVPYQLLLPPLLECLEASGVQRADITLLIATGMHRPSTASERVEIFGERICRDYRVVDHDATDDAQLVRLPTRTSAGTEVRVNRHFAEAGLTITTGLVEPHFMAGYSGGRKSVCPGIVNLTTIQQFHGPGFLENPLADSGVLAGNPCHREASEVAHIAGVDFILNVALNLDREVIGVCAGDLDMAFEEAVRCVDTHCGVTVDAEADVVLTSGGGYPLDVTFYQVVKGIVGAVPAVRRGGTIVIAAECSAGVGSEEYRKLLHAYAGDYDRFLSDITTSSCVRRDQWELEVQCRALRKVGVEGIVLCSAGIASSDCGDLCVTDGRASSSATEPSGVLQDVADACIRRTGDACRVAVIPDGPYVLVRGASA